MKVLIEELEDVIAVSTEGISSSLSGFDVTNSRKDEMQEVKIMKLETVILADGMAIAEGQSMLAACVGTGFHKLYHIGRKRAQNRPDGKR